MIHNYSSSSWMSFAKRQWRQWRLRCERSLNSDAQIRPHTGQATAVAGFFRLSFLAWRLESSWFRRCSAKALTPDSVDCLQAVRLAASSSQPVPHSSTHSCLKAPEGAASLCQPARDFFVQGVKRRDATNQVGEIPNILKWSTVDLDDWLWFTGTRCCLVQHLCLLNADRQPKGFRSGRETVS